MNNKHLSWYKEINNNFIIASRAYFLQSPTCTRVNNLDYIVMILTPMESWCWSFFARERGLVNGSATFRSVCILQISMSPSLTWSRMELKRLLMCLCNIPNFQFGMLYIDHSCISYFIAFSFRDPQNSKQLKDPRRKLGISRFSYLIFIKYWNKDHFGFSLFYLRKYFIVKYMRGDNMTSPK